MRFRSFFPPLIAAVLSGWVGLASACADGPRTVVGELTWPTRWQVLAPLEQGSQAPAPSVLRSIPDALELDGKTFEGQDVDVPDARLDLAPFLGGTQAGRTAYVFLTVNAAADGPVTLGMGADWWMQVWVDGKLVCDTTATGNELWPPHITNFTRNVPLTAGPHVVAVRFISGAGSSVLTLGGPAQLRAVPPPAWASVKRTPPVVLGPETVPNGGFEEGDGDPWRPREWTNAGGGNGFAAGELGSAPGQALAGERSLEIDTLAGPSRRRKLFTRLSLVPGELYEVSYKAKHLAGGYVSVSLRDKPVGPCVTYFLAGGLVRKGHRGVYTGYYFFEDPSPYLVIEARDPAHVLIDELSIRLCPDSGKKWSSWQEQRIAWGPDWDRITHAVVTPHTPVAKPCASGTLRLLALRPRWEQRWAAELAQRFDVACEPLMFRDNNSLGVDYWLRDTDGEPVLHDVLAASVRKAQNPADCVVVSRLSASAIPDELVETILARVVDGSGLVITGFGQPFYPYPDGRDDAAFEKYKQGPWSVALCAANVTAEETDVVRLGPIEGARTDFYTYGKGRIACLQSAEIDGVTLRSTDPDNPRDRFEFEMAYVMKAALWASRRLPGPAILSVGLPGGPPDVVPDAWRGRVARGDLPLEAPVAFSAAVPDNAELTLRICDRHGTSLPEARLPIAVAGRRAVLHVPALPAGRHDLHLTLRTAGIVVDWAVAVLDVTADPAIREIRLEPGARPCYRRGDRVRGSVLLGREPGPGHRVRLALVDMAGRIWAEHELPPAGAEAAFDVPTDDLVGLTHRLRAELFDKGAVVDRAVHEFVVVPPNNVYRTELDAQIWQLHAADYVGSLLAEVARRELDLGSVLYPGHGPAKGDGRSLARANIRPLGGIAYYPGRRNELAGDKAYAPEREPCLASAGLRNSLAAVGKKWSLRALPFGMLAYTTDHEQNLLGCTGRLKSDADICFSPTCLADMREFLRAEYATLAALNACWGTAFETWDDVRPAVLSQAVADGQIPRWIDHRRHMDRVWTDFTNYKLEFLREHDPNALGIIDNVRSGETTCDSYNGIDYWTLLNEAVAGAAVPMPYLLAFVPPERRHLVWLRDAAWHPDKWSGHRELLDVRLASLPWRALLSGAGGYTYWAWVWRNRPESNVMAPVWPDLRPTYLGRAVAETGRRIRSGLDQFVMESRRHDSGIGLYYSRPSEHVWTAWRAVIGDALADELDPRSSQFRFFAPALRAAGRQFAAVAYGQVAQGALRDGRVRLLILPFAQAIARRECEEIRRFVRAGGTVLADIRPAVCDEHGRPGPDGALLDDVFGVRHKTELTAYVPTTGTVRVNGTLSGDALELEIADVLAGPELMLTTGTARASCCDRPALIVNRFGKGKAVLLNVSGRANGGRDDAWDTLWDTILADCGIGRLFEIDVRDEWWLTGDDETIRLDDRQQSRESAAAANAGEDPGAVEGIAAARSMHAVPTLVRFSNGGIECFGLWFGQRRGRGGQTLDVRLPVSGRVYDLLTNRYHGRRTAFRATLHLEGLAAWAVTPYKIGTPKLEARFVNAGGTDSPRIVCGAELRPKAARSERHVVRFRLFAPDGSEWPEFAADVTASEGVARHAFVLPRNAPEGTWTVTAREALSGLTDKVRVRR